MGAEMLLQYLWEHRLWTIQDMVTVDGEPVAVLDPGLRNSDSGPDFFNAKLIIGGRLWAGNVEIHVRASDWFAHHHDSDHAYDSVILHVVGTSDHRVSRPDGSLIPQLVLPWTPDFRDRYDKMVADRSTVLPCGPELGAIPPVHVSDWISALGFERLYAKAERIAGYNDRLEGDWRATAYVTLARALGFSVNGEPFERLALSTPLRILLKHRNEPLLVEAALYGQAGFLDVNPADPDARAYVEALRRDYQFMRLKYNLEPMERSVWKMARMRPANFPHRRLAALATMIAGGFEFGTQVTGVDGEAAARKLLEFTLGGFWVNHYTFSAASNYAPRALSVDSVTSLLINAVVPLLYAFGLHYGDNRATDRAISLLQSLAPESNSIVGVFTDAGLACPDAFTSQALIQLRRAYCEPRKCIYCRFGHRILAAKARP